MSTEPKQSIIPSIYRGNLHRGNMSRADELFAPDFVEREELRPDYRLVVRASNS